ncbi:MAG: C4-dicarboxylate ABC transporter permease, partial [Clostridiales bacterium]|nr:C4-dicarboxylate ABC transporter permease [Clostridiales bacterium]
MTDKVKTMTESELALDVDKLLEEYDAEASKARKLTGTVGKVVAIIAILMSVFHLYTAGFGTLLSVKQRSLHV